MDLVTLEPFPSCEIWSCGCQKQGVATAQSGRWVERSEVEEMGARHAVEGEESLGEDLPKGGMFPLVQCPSFPSQQH